MSITVISRRSVQFLLGKLSVTLPQEEFLELEAYISTMEELLDETDKDDVHGSSGWMDHAGIQP